MSWLEFAVAVLAGAAVGGAAVFVFVCWLMGVAHYILEEERMKA